MAGLLWPWRRVRAGAPGVGLVSPPVPDLGVSQTCALAQGQREAHACEGRGGEAALPARHQSVERVTSSGSHGWPRSLRTSSGGQQEAGRKGPCSGRPASSFERPSGQCALLCPLPSPPLRPRLGFRGARACWDGRPEGGASSVPPTQASPALGPLDCDMKWPAQCELQPATCLSPRETSVGRVPAAALPQGQGPPATLAPLRWAHLVLLWPRPPPGGTV